ncbi:hypothetical protein GCM10010530_22000 [Kribbella aluminosa]
MFYVGLAALLIFAASAAKATYGLATGRPVLTINLHGIDLGGCELTWKQVRRIELRPSSATRRLLAIGYPTVRLSGDKPHGYIDVSTDHITDLESFAGWLSSEQNEISGRRTANGS